MRTACVTIHDSQGRRFSHVTAAATVLDAVREAMEWFLDPFWHGPKPTAETVYDVSLVGDSRAWTVANRAGHWCITAQ